MHSTFFTEEESKEKIGKKIRTRWPFANVPEGSTGTVITSFDSEISSPKRFGIYIRWDLETPLIDGFSKDEYDQFLEEIVEEPACLCKDCKMTEQMCRHRKSGASIPSQNQKYNSLTQLLAVTLEQIEKEENSDQQKNPEYSLGILSTVTRIRETFGMPKPKGK